MLNFVSEVAVIVDDPSAHLQPSISELESWNDEQQASFRQQIIANKTKATKRDNGRSFSEEALKKRTEREERRRLATKKLAEESNAEDISVSSLNVSRPEPDVAALSTQLSISEQPPAASANYIITIPAASEYQWYNADQATFTTIESAQKAGIWTYPSNLSERARCGVFGSLSAQGYFMGSGIKFGGDYLVYPG